MSKNDGGPAFPNRADNSIAYPYYDGMTLRDYFAGQALGEIAREVEAWSMHQPQEHQLTGRDTAKVAAGRAYMYADAMLAAREISK